MARIGPRVVALCIDWALAMVVSHFFFDGDATANLVIFGAMTLVLVGLTGHTIGHRIMGMQVQRVAGGPVRPLDGVVRTLLMCLVVPAFVTDADQRGLHDRVRGTILVKIR